MLSRAGRLSFSKMAFSVGWLALVAKKSGCAVWEATPTPKRADDKNEKQLIEDHVEQTNELHSAAKFPDLPMVFIAVRKHQKTI
jgi:hypothetical protein